MKLVYVVTWLLVQTFWGACPQTPDPYGRFSMSVTADFCPWADTTAHRAEFSTRAEVDTFIAHAPRPLAYPEGGFVFDNDVAHCTNFKVDSTWVDTTWGGAGWVPEAARMEKKP